MVEILVVGRALLMWVGQFLAFTYMLTTGGGIVGERAGLVVDMLEE